VSLAEYLWGKAGALDGGLRLEVPFSPSVMLPRKPLGSRLLGEAYIVLGKTIHQKYKMRFIFKFYYLYIIL